MTDYKKIQGFEVQTLSSDPTETGWIGSIFYNSTSGTFKTVKPGGIAAGTWSSGGNLNTAGYYRAYNGTQTASMVVGGEPGTLTTVEQYDGSSWSEMTENGTAKAQAGGAGIATAGLFFGGKTPVSDALTQTEYWNGSAWTEQNDLNTGRHALGGCGVTYNAAFAVGGYIGGGAPGNKANAEIFNGTSWTEVGDLNLASAYLSVFGTTTAAIRAGSASGSLNQVESWNGTSWTETTEMNQGRYGAGASGISTDGLFFGGIEPTQSSKTESWNGSAWTELNDMGTARYGVAGTMSSSSATLATGGFTPVTTATEEWTVPDLVINTLTTS
jgi:hypothetical protein